jgi:hypothetical protein
MGALSPWHVLVLLICLAAVAGIAVGLVMLIRRR